MKNNPLIFITILLVFSVCLSACGPIPKGVDDLPKVNKPITSSEPTRGSLVPLPQIQPSSATWFGMGSNTHMRSNDVDRDYAEMASLGVRFVREDIPWQEIQIDDTNYSFDYRGGILYRAIDAADKYNLEILAMLAYSPPENYKNASKAEFIKFWKGYVQAVVDSFGDHLDYWEIGNEISTLWGKVRGTKEFEPDIYVSMLSEAYRIIKTHDPTDTVIMSSLVNTDSLSQGLDPFETMRQLANLDAERYCDALALHVYWPSQDPDQPKSNLIYGNPKTLNLRDYVTTFISESEKQYGISLPLWITETGYDARGLSRLREAYSLTVERLQGALLVKTYVTLISIPEVQSVFWYTWFNDDTGQNYDLEQSGKDAYKTMTVALSGGTSLGQFDVFHVDGTVLEQVMDYRFARPDGKVVSYNWSESSSTSSLWARLKPVNAGQVVSVAPDKYFQDQPQERGPQDLFIVGITPNLLFGQIEPSTHIVLGDEEQKAALPPIVYLKDGNVWAYFLEEDRYLQITQDGADYGLPGERYSDPNISPDGRYLAFTQAGSNFVIYNFENSDSTYIPMASSPDILGDTLLGWGKNNQLYYTRMIGGCDFTGNDIKGPDAMQVYFYNPDTGYSNYVFDLPKVNDASHAYSIGIRISPDGNRVLAYNAACSVDLASTFVYDVKSGKVTMHYEGMHDFSPDGSYIASSEHQTRFTQPLTHWIEITDQNGNLVKSVHMRNEAGELAIDPRFSNTGRYLLFTEAIPLEEGLTFISSFMKYAQILPEQIFLYSLDQMNSSTQTFNHVGPAAAWKYFGAFSPDDHFVAILEGDPLDWRDKVDLSIYDIETGEVRVIDQVLRSAEVDW